MGDYNKVGDGTFGAVYLIKSPTSGTQYALKRNFSEIDTSFISALREAHMLCHLTGHPNIVPLHQITFSQAPTNKCFSPIDFKTRESQRNDAIHFMFEPADYDLHVFINNANTPDFGLCKRYMVQLLLGLEFLHTSGIVHRDIKPSNILIVKSDLDVLGVPNQAKICDFGLAKPYTYQGVQTPNTVTSWYRSPEITVGYPNYDYKADVWSLGCVFYELILREVFVYSKEDNNDKLISTILAVLPEEITTRQFRTWVSSKKWRNVKLRDNYKPKTRKSFRQRLDDTFTPELLSKFEKEAGSADKFCEVLSMMLRFDPRERSTVTECLNHEFFADFKELITATREQYKSRKREYKVEITYCQERDFMVQIVYDIFNNRDILKWYSHRILFQAIDLFDRHLTHKFKTTTFADNAIESEFRGKLYDQRETELRFLTCLYISLKYFTSLQTGIPFVEIINDDLKTKEDLAVAELFEETLVVDELNFDIYRDTVFEAADFFNDILIDEDVRGLLMFICSNPSVNGHYPYDIYNYYRNNLKNVELEALAKPVTIK